MRRGSGDRVHEEVKRERRLTSKEESELARSDTEASLPNPKIFGASSDGIISSWRGAGRYR